MKVFTSEYIQRIKKRYRNNKAWNKPSLYQISVCEEYKVFRDEIEAMFALLSPNEQKKVISRLQSEELYLHARHELAVGWLLKQLGYQVEYEQSFEAKSSSVCTPDWYVHPTDKAPAFVIEVFTSSYDSSEENQNFLNQVKDLEGRLREINCNVSLMVDLEYESSDTNNESLTPIQSKRIAREIRQWLENQPPNGAMLEGNGFIYHDIKYTTDFSNVQPVIVPKAEIVDSRKLRNKISEKIKKYKHLEMPLVVCLFIDSVWGWLYLRGVLMGKSGGRVLYDNPIGLFEEKPELSAVVWIDRKSPCVDGWEILAIYNKAATKPLPGNTFGEYHCVAREFTPTY